MPKAMLNFRPIQAKIDRTALIHNLGVILNLVPHQRVWSVIKANAYGHGALEMAMALNQSKQCHGLALIELDQAEKIRKAHIHLPILMLEGLYSHSELAAYEALNLTAVIHHQKQIEFLQKTICSKPIPIYLKINIDMNRLGFSPQDIPFIMPILQEMQRSGKIRLQAIMTHFANADNQKGIDKALTVFQQICQSYPSLESSCANSAAIIAHAEQTRQMTWVRPGIMLYGVSAYPELYPAKDLLLKPVMTLFSQIISTQIIHAGESIGYGSLFTANKTTNIGIVACGYADGYPRHAPSGTPVLVNQQRTRLLGRVSMDKIVVDLSDITEADVGSEVILWGKDLPIEEIAKKADTIAYELLCHVSDRVPKLFV